MIYLVASINFKLTIAKQCWKHEKLCLIQSYITLFVDVVHCTLPVQAAPRRLRCPSAARAVMRHRRERHIREEWVGMRKGAEEGEGEGRGMREARGGVSHESHECQVGIIKG